MKIYRLAYYIDHATAFIIDGNCEITKVDTHIQGIIELYDLNDGLVSTFKDNFGEELDWDKDWDTVVDYVHDFMQDQDIFAVVADFPNHHIYVRPRMGEQPNARQMKELSDWAVENGCSEEIIVDMVIAKQNNVYRLANKSSQAYPIQTIWDTWHTRKEKLKKEAALNGEWWIIDGYAQFADGDIGDLNHEGAAIQSARGSILGDLGSIEDADFIDWDAFREKTCHEFIEKSSQYDDLTEEYENNPVEFFWQYICKPNGVERPVFEMAEDMCDIRAVAMQHWGHKRMVGTVIETYTLTPQDLDSITAGIWNAYDDSLDGAENTGREITFTIEVDATRSLYEDVPVSVLEKNNVASLAPYRVRY